MNLLDRVREVLRVWQYLLHTVVCPKSVQLLGRTTEIITYMELNI